MKSLTFLLCYLIGFVSIGLTHQREKIEIVQSTERTSLDGRFVLRDIAFTPGYYGKTSIMLDRQSEREYIVIEGVGIALLEK